MFFPLLRQPLCLATPVAVDHCALFMTAATVPLHAGCQLMFLPLLPLCLATPVAVDLPAFFMTAATVPLHAGC
jgi:hypothetical protein